MVDTLLSINESERLVSKLVVLLMYDEERHVFFVAFGLQKKTRDVKHAAAADVERCVVE
jgi:hypothetical protein